MDVFITFFILIVVGAIIGGVTNALAIRMLFRPFYPVYIGKWRLPFTPGLIPKRRDAMAKQLGSVVVDHLLTANGIKNRMKNEQFQNEMMLTVKKGIGKFLESEKTINELADQFAIKHVDRRLEEWIGNKVEGKYQTGIEKLSEKTIEELVPTSLCSFIEDNIPKLSVMILKKVIHFFDSEEGKQKIADLIDRFFADKGSFGSMINMFFGNGGLVNKVHPEVMKFLNQPAANELLEQMIRKEWTSLKKQRFKDVEHLVNHKQITGWMKDQFLRQLELTNILQTPIRRLSAPYQTTILDEWVPKAFTLLSNYLAEHVGLFMRKLQLDDIVKKQVESFPVERLETIILAIARRELKMITYLGALLGGLIATVQGVLILFV